MKHSDVRHIFFLVMMVACLKTDISFTQALHSMDLAVPHDRTIQWKKQSGFADAVLASWAARPFSDDNINGKGNATRILLAKLMLNRDIDLVNATIHKLTVWGVSGTSWAMNKNGDYDFTITPLTTLLYLFGDQPKLLYPATQAYLLETLLSEEGNHFRTKAPNSMGMVPETENHILMTEGSRYLKNRWLMLHGSNHKLYDNLANGMEALLLDFLEQMKKNGLYEFNSIPYIGYTIAALLNLEAFASDSVKAAARNVLDYMNWTYALGSYRLNHYPPMRRRYEKSVITELSSGYQSAFMKSWLSFSPVQDFNQHLEGGGEVHALMGVCLPYRPADKVVELLFDKGEGYFVKLAHGKNACPEIYTAGKKFLLSAGGANRGEWSQIVARPISLFLADEAKDLAEIFHLAGPGTDFKKWNNTGVYKNFACAAGPVIIPAAYQPVAGNQEWSIYSVGNGLLVAVYSSDNLGLLAVFEQKDARKLLARIVSANPQSKQLYQQFLFPDGDKIVYEVTSPKDKWVIKSINDKETERDFDNWPLMGKNEK